MDNKPFNFIEKDKFVDIVYDINLLEGGLENVNMNQFEFKDTAMKLYKGIFEKHDISYKTFKKNQDYYILTDQYREITQLAADRASYELAKYGEIEPIKPMSLVQFSQLLELDKLLYFMENDTSFTFMQKMDSVTNYYRQNPQNFSVIDMDSLSFEVSMTQLRRSKNLFQKVPMEVFKSKTQRNE